MWLINATCKFKKTTFFFFKEIEFVDGSLLKLKSYIEVYLEQPVEFKLLWLKWILRKLYGRQNWESVSILHLELKLCLARGVWGRVRGSGSGGKQIECLSHHHNIKKFD